MKIEWFSMGETWQGTQSEKNLYTLDLRTSRKSAPWSYGRITCIMRCALHFSVCRRASQNQRCCMFLHNYVESSMHNHKDCTFSTPWTLREIARSLVIFFSLILQMPKISSLYDIDKSRTRGTPSHSGDRDARGRHNFRANYIYLPKKRENAKNKTR